MYTALSNVLLQMNGMHKIYQRRKERKKSPGNILKEITYFIKVPDMAGCPVDTRPSHQYVLLPQTVTTNPKAHYYTQGLRMLLHSNFPSLERKFVSA